MDMLPAPGDTWWDAAVVESDRRVAGDVLERNGHIDLDWRKRASMMGNCSGIRWTWIKKRGIKRDGGRGEERGIEKVK